MWASLPNTCCCIGSYPLLLEQPQKIFVEIQVSIEYISAGSLDNLLL